MTVGQVAERFEALTDPTWRDFCAAPAAVLVLSESRCPICAAWSRELREHLQRRERWPGVRFGKIELDLPTAREFKEANADWLELVEGVPFNVIYVGGEPKASFSGAGIERLENRLSRLAPGV